MRDILRNLLSVHISLLLGELEFDDHASCFDWEKYLLDLVLQYPEPRE